MFQGCLLQINEKKQIVFQSVGAIQGTLFPKNGKEYQVVIKSDNPDITSLVTEKRLVEQAAKELEKQIGYNIKIWHQFEFPTDRSIDASLEFSSTDPYFSTDNILAWGGFPNGGLRGRAVFNNKHAWLDGYNRTGAQLRALGIILPNMIDTRSYQTFNVRQTVKHELFGHVFGLQHTEDSTDIMFPIYDFERVLYGKDSKKTLHDNYGTASYLKRAVPDSYIKSVMQRRERF